MHEQELRVRVGYQEDFSPFAALGPEGPEGLAVDILARGFESLGVEVSWMPLPLDRQLSSLSEGEVDLLACLGITDERRREVVFGEPILLTGGAIFRLLEMPTELVRIATPSAGPLTTVTKNSFPDCSLVTVDDYPTALKLVVEGRADAAALNAHVGQQVAEREFPGKFDFSSPIFHEVSLAPAWALEHDGQLREALINAIAIEDFSGPDT